MVLRKVISVFTLVAASLLDAPSANAKAFYISGSSNRISGGTSCDDPLSELLSTVGEGNGLNLSNVAVDALAPLAFDKSGAARPASGPWNVGPF
jgi:hypothetical protein